ncbi:CHAT domain-containing protein [Armillaria borealis]|uniref:CHAT domain-containing protein n=1 Tax=Armillaria borealis TaxID=47425 RepID=A0AA39IWZ3_9AGAR|nr:CHAT domain-containing protein [Armillaria borealis]
MSHQHFSHHHSDGESKDEGNGLELRRVSGAQDSETDSADSFADRLLHRWSTVPEARTPYDHTFLQSLQRDRSISSLDKLITFSEFAIPHYPDDHPSKALHLFELGTALKKKELEEEALGAYERALNGAVVDSNDPYGLPLVSICFYSINDLLKGRYDRLGEAEDLNKAIWAQEMCIACTAADGENLVKLYGSLLNSLVARWNLLKDEEDLDRMLSCAEKAVALNTSNAHAQYNLSRALHISYDHHYTLALLDRAILALQSTVSYSMPHDRMEMLTELAKSYHRRFHRVRDPSDASACIKYLDQAMECGKISFSLHLMLMDCLNVVFKENNDVQYDERARLICETLLADDSLSNIERCMALMVLGDILIDSYKRPRAPPPDPRRLEEGIQIIERAIECIPPEHQALRTKPYLSLSYALELRLKIGTPTVSDFEYAISIAKKTVELSTELIISWSHNDFHAYCLWLLGNILHAYGHAFPSRKDHEQYISVFRQASRMSSPRRFICLASAVAVAECCFSMEDWEGGFDAFTIAMEAVNHQTWLGLSVVQQHRVISRTPGQMVWVGKSAARAAVHLGFSGMALEWIEQCRSIVWQRILNLRVSMDALAGVEPPLARRLKEISDMLQRDAYFDLLGMEEGSLEMRKQQRYRLAEEWDELVAQTRSLPGFTDFLKPKDSAYFTSCEFGGMVVLLNIFSETCDVIVLGSNKGKVVSFRLGQMNGKLATSLQTRLRETFQQSGRHSRDTRASRIWSGHAGHDVMSDMLSVLWTTVVKPLFDFLDLKPRDSSSESDPPRLWWCPTGPLSFLPLHAAGLYNTAEHGTKVYEFVASSYTPTVGILADISNQRSEEFSGLLTVCQPHTPGQHPIPKTEDEVCSVVQVAVESGLAMDITSLDKDDATPDAVLSGMAEHSWIHLACHACQDLTQPLESAFMLAGDPKEGCPLKLTEIAKRANTNADFAFLSACQTVTGDASLSEESVHLAAGMLMAGYRRVIATMWAVNDSDAPIIAENVYKHMLSDGKADSGKSCLALHHATASMRQKVGEKNFMSWVPFIHFGA